MLIDQIYNVKKQLGKGMTSDVYLVDSSKGELALKLLKTKSDLPDPDTLIDAFKFEFSFLKDASHPNIAPIYDFGFDNQMGRFYFTQECIDGVPLDEYAKDQSLETIQDLLIQCLEGLSFIHKADILHGDLKPSNIFVIQKDGQPIVKIIDFGISHPDLQIRGGTPAYFAPEKVQNNKPAATADLYALGVIFYKLLTGINPFVKKKIKETMNAHLTVIPEAPALLNNEITPVLNDILVNLLKKNPYDRLSSAEEVLEALHAEGRRDVPLLSPITHKWIGRESIKKQIEEWVLKRNDPNHVGIVVGQEGAGKSRLLEEIKYTLQLEGITVMELGEDLSEIEKRENTVFISTNVGRPPIAPTNLGNNNLFLTESLPEDIETLKNESTSLTTWELPLFTKSDVEALLQETTKKSPPDKLVDLVFSETKGHPGYTVKLLRTLAKRFHLIDENGDWNLSPFEEGAMDLTVGDAEIDVLDQAILVTENKEQSKKANLFLQKAALLIHTNKFKEAGLALLDSKKVIDEMEANRLRAILKISWYEKTGWLYLKENKLDKARKGFDRAIVLLEEYEIEHLVPHLRIQNFIGRIGAQEGKLDKAIEIFKDSREKFENLSEQDQSYVTNNDLGYAYFLKHDYKNAIKIFLEDIQYFEKLKNNISQARCLYNLGECHYALKNYTDAIRSYQSLIIIAREAKQFPLLLRAYNGLGNTYLVLGNSLKSIDFYKRALDLARYLKDTLSAATISQNRGALLKEMGQSKEALKDLHTSLKYIEKLPPTDAHTQYLEARALVEIAEIHRIDKHFPKTLTLLDRALRITENPGAPKSFRYYVLEGLCQLALDQKNEEVFKEHLSHLVYEAKTDEQKKHCELLKKRGEDMIGSGSEKMSTVVAEAPKRDRTIIAMEPINRLLDIGKLLVNERNVTTLLDQILRHACDLSKAESGLIILTNDEGELNVEASLNLKLDKELDQVSKNIAQKALTTGEIIFTDDAQDDPDFNQYESVVALNLRSILCLPITYLNKVMGVLYLTHRFQNELFNDESLKVLSAFSDYVGVALENARLFEELNQKNVELKNSLKKSREERDHFKFLAEHGEGNAFGKIIGKSGPMIKLYDMMKRVADTPLSVLIRGESGTGKEMVAREIHKNSSRRNKPFVAVNCAALPENLIESELFGHKAGSFTGATKDKKGLFEEASGGTVLLDEIGELKPALQAKLLRVLQEGELTRVGETFTRKVDIRVLSATLINVEEAIATGRFREDLLYRLKQMELIIPPLRKRPDDIPLLVQEFITGYGKETNARRAPKISKKLMDIFMSYNWPGNVRELENRVRVACALSDGKTLKFEDLPPQDQELLTVGAGSPHPKMAPSASEAHKQNPRSTTDEPLSLFLNPIQKWKEIELTIMAKALLHFGFDAIKAAKSLDVGQATLYNRMRKYKIKETESKWDENPYHYEEGTKLDDIQREVFQKVLELKDDKPYHAAKELGVTPATFYKWIR